MDKEKNARKNFQNRPLERIIFLDFWKFLPKISVFEFLNAGTSLAIAHTTFWRRTDSKKLEKPVVSGIDRIDEVGQANQR